MTFAKHLNLPYWGKTTFKIYTKMDMFLRRTSYRKILTKDFEILIEDLQTFYKYMIVAKGKKLKIYVYRLKEDRNLLKQLKPFSTANLISNL